MASPLDFYLNPSNFGSVPQNAQGIAALNALQGAQGPLANLNRTGTMNDGTYARPGQVGPNLTQGGVMDMLSRAESQPLVDPLTGNAQNWLLQNLMSSSNPGVISRFTGQQNPFGSPLAQNALQQALTNRSNLLNQARGLIQAAPNIHQENVQNILGNTPVDQNFGNQIAMNTAIQSGLNKPTGGSFGQQLLGQLPTIASVFGGPLGFFLNALRQQQQSQNQVDRQKHMLSAIGNAAAARAANMKALQHRSQSAQYRAL